MIKVGDKVVIEYMNDESNYSGREGIVTLIDDMGQIHGTWGGLAIIPEEDIYHVIKD